MSRALWIILAAMAAVGVVFAVWPGLDLAAARYFYGDQGFIGRGELAGLGRDVFRITPFVVLAAFVIAYLLARWGKQAEFRLGQSATPIVAAWRGRSAGCARICAGPRTAAASSS